MGFVAVQAVSEGKHQIILFDVSSSSTRSCEAFRSLRQLWRWSCFWGMMGIHELTSCLSHVLHTSVMWRWSLSLMQQPLAVLWKQLSQLTQIVLSWKLSRHSPVSPWDKGHGACGATVLINRPEISSAAGSSEQTGCQSLRRGGGVRGVREEMTTSLI